MWMTAGAVLVALGVVLFVLQPLVTGRKAPLRREDDEPTEAEARKRVALLALRDVEYDYATGKLDDEDYEDLRGELAAEALQALQAEARMPVDGHSPPEEDEAREPGESDVGGYPAGRSLDELEQEIAAYRTALRKGVFCASCGHLNEGGSRFCAQCGSPLEEDEPEPAGAGAAAPDQGSGGGGSGPAP